MTQNAHIEKLDRYLRAKFPLIGITSHEENRVLAAIDAVAVKRGRKVSTWSFTDGVTGVDVIDPADTQAPDEALRQILSYLKAESISGDAFMIFVLKDLHHMLNDSMVVRYLRDIANTVSQHTVILLSPALEVPSDLEKAISVIDWPLPSFDELSAILNKVEISLPANIDVTINGNREELVRSMQGLTAFEAESVLLSSIAATGSLSDDIIAEIVKEKANVIKQAPGLEYIPVPEEIKAGGLHSLDSYTRIKLNTYTAAAKKAGVDPAKGVMLVGIPGTGKSLSAKVIAGGRMPLLRWGLGAMKGGIVGQSEANIRKATKIAEAVAPAVIWMDEIEKALPSQSGELDGGVQTGMLGYLLTWMQETTAPLYIVATANDVRSLKPELLRRFDDIFFVGLPDHKGRVEILDIHLSKRKADVDGLDLDKVAEHTWSFTGAEIEKVVKAGKERAFFQGQELTTDHLLVAAGEIIPISTTMSDKIDELQAWAKTRARAAGPALEPKPANVQVRTIEL